MESQLFAPEHCALETSERCSNPSPSLPQVTSLHPTARSFLGVSLALAPALGSLYLAGSLTVGVFSYLSCVKQSCGTPLVCRLLVSLKKSDPRKTVS